MDTLRHYEDLEFHIYSCFSQSPMLNTQTYVHIMKIGWLFFATGVRVRGNYEKIAASWEREKDSQNTERESISPLVIAVADGNTGLNWIYQQTTGRGINKLFGAWTPDDQDWDEEKFRHVRPLASLERNRDFAWFLLQKARMAEQKLSQQQRPWILLPNLLRIFPNIPHPAQDVNRIEV